ncbi:MAG: hypothetical protein JZU65_19575 [Chlorobium sp.]|nr:hypothetical protein [Chlorobium sp.]
MNNPVVSEEIEEAVAWWLLYDDGQPDTFTRFIGNAPEVVEHRKNIAAQVHRLIEEATNAGIGQELIAVFEQLCLRQHTEKTT